MNSNPKLKINKVTLDNDFDFKTYFFDDTNALKDKIFWNQNGVIEMVCLDFVMSSDFSNYNEYIELSDYYRNVIDYNSDLDIPLVFIGSSFDFNKKTPGSPWSKFPNGKFFIPKTLLISKKGRKELFSISTNNNTDKQNLTGSNLKKSNFKIKCELQSETSKKKFTQIINKSIDMIESNQISKVVLSRQKHYKIDSNQNILFNFLKNAEKEPIGTTSFIYDFKEKGTFFGVTPETLFNIKDNILKTEALAGTVEDDYKAGFKELEEHSYVVDYIADTLSNFSDKINLNKSPTLFNLGKISHLHTKIKSNINKGYDIFDILYKMHPTPAVAGIPKKESLDIISSLEKHNRGWYGGPLGWIDSKFSANFVVGIRSGFIDDDDLYIYAGCGIVESSIPDKEFIESELKFDYILSILKNE